MAIDHQEPPDSMSGGGGSSSAGGSVVSKSPPVLSSTDSDEAVAAAEQLKSKEDRRRKGKMLAVDETPLQPPAVEKLMGDAILSGRTQSHNTDLLTSSVFDDISVVSDKLRNILRGLGAVNPVRVYAKKMSLADRYNDQNRLLMSCKDNKKKSRKRSHGDDHCKATRFASIFSAMELDLVNQPDQRQRDDEDHGENNNGEKNRKKNKKKRTEKEKEDAEAAKPGLDVQAYDRNGEVYRLKCRFLTSNVAYRIIGRDWTHFLRTNNLLVEKTGDQKRRKGKKLSPKEDGSEGQSSSLSLERNGNGGRTRPEIDNVRIELWVFRSRKLDLGCTDQEQGALGMVLLHYREEDGADRHVDVGHAGTEVPSGSEDVVEPEGPHRHQDAVMPGLGEGAHDMVMAEPGDVPAMVLPVIVVVDAAAALFDMGGVRATQRELEAAEGLLRLGHEEKMFEVDSGAGCYISALS